jgi:F-type H+-transporting ATPase subunit delta
MARKQGDKELVARYARALFASAKHQDKLQAVETETQRVAEIFALSQDVVRLVSSPVFSREQQTAGINAVLENAGINGITREFCLVLAANRRLALFPAIVEAFLTLLSEAKGEVTVEVISANTLQEKHISAISSSLAASLGKKLRVKTAVDASILGGLIVKIGSTMIDDSLKSKLQRLQAASKKAIAAL